MFSWWYNLTLKCVFYFWHWWKKIFVSNWQVESFISADNTISHFVMWFSLYHTAVEHRSALLVCSIFCLKKTPKSSQINLCWCFSDHPSVQKLFSELVTRFLFFIKIQTKTYPTFYIFDNYYIQSDGYCHYHDLWVKMIQNNVKI